MKKRIFRSLVTIGLFILIVTGLLTFTKGLSSVARGSYANATPQGTPAPSPSSSPSRRPSPRPSPTNIVTLANSNAQSGAVTERIAKSVAGRITCAESEPKSVTVVPLTQQSCEG
jgi:hypothetical protein